MKINKNKPLDLIVKIFESLKQIVHSNTIVSFLYE